MGPILVNVDQRLIDSGRNRIQLPWRVFEALRLLVQARGAVVERETLLRLLWPGVHVEESSLNQCISQLRKALDAGGEELIETVPRRGYRLVAPVETLQDEKGAEALPEPPRPSPRSNRLTRIVLAAVALLAFSAAAGFVWMAWREREQRRESDRLAGQALQIVRRARLRDYPAANETLRRALAVYPRAALARAVVAEAMARSGESEPHQPAVFAEEAVRQDAGCADCQAILGWIQMTREWKWRQAGERLEAAARLKPRDARIRLWRSQWLAAHGSLDRALREIDEAARLEPADPAVFVMKAGVLYLSGRYETAVAEARRALALDPGRHDAWDWIYRAAILLNRNELAIEAQVNATALFLGLSPDLREHRLEDLLDAHRYGGLSRVVERLLLGNDTPTAIEQRCYERATWRMWLKDYPGALAELSNGSSFRPFQLIYVAVDPMFEPLRETPAFQRVVERVGLMPR